MLKKISLVTAFILLTVTAALAWSQKEINNRINETNMVIGDWCSGTVIDKRLKLIVTANHCLQPVTYFVSIRKELDNDRVVTVIRKMYHKVPITHLKFTDEGDQYSETDFYAVVLGSDPVTDVAILQATGTNLGIYFNEESRLSTVLPKRGDKVWTVGNPYMIYGSLSEGIISNPKIKINVGSGPIIVISYTAHTYPGSSGGALYNDVGELIGITNWGSGTGGGPYLASPIINVINLLERLNLK